MAVWVGGALHCVLTLLKSRCLFYSWTFLLLLRAWLFLSGQKIFSVHFFVLFLLLLIFGVCFSSCLFWKFCQFKHWNMPILFHNLISRRWGFYNSLVFVISTIKHDISDVKQLKPYNCSVILTVWIKFRYMF